MSTPWVISVTLKEGAKTRDFRKVSKHGLCCCQRTTELRHHPSRGASKISAPSNLNVSYVQPDISQGEGTDHLIWKFNNDSSITWIIFHDLMDQQLSVDSNLVIAGLWEVVRPNKHEGYVIAPFIASLEEDNAEEEMMLPILRGFFTKLLPSTISHLVCWHKCSIEQSGWSSFLSSPLQLIT